MKTTRIIALALLVLSTINYQPSTFAQGTAFNYQGRLSDNGAPANGSYDLEFTIYDALTGGSVVGGPIFNSPTAVSNGLFTVTLDFGPGVFAGPPRFLEIGVRTNGGGMDHTPLSPRQPILATPYAITAGNLAGSLQATQLNGVIPSAQLAGVYSGAVTFSNPSNSFSGDGSGLINVGLDSSAVWKLAGNSNTIPGTHFVGTRDNQPLELQVNRQRALRLEPNTNGAPNIIGGSPLNGVDAGVVGAAVGGGGATNFFGVAYSNRVSGSFGTIAGGGQNTIQTNAFAANIAGGFENTIQTDSFFSTIEGGRSNTNAARFAIIGGGNFNTIQTNAVQATIGGGSQNTIQTNASSSTIGGGSSNTNGGRFATVPGGNANAAMRDYSFAAGRQAKANHDGAFVWADSTAADFASSASNQFLIRASGGVGIGKTNPASALDVNGTVTASTFAGSGVGLSNVNASSLSAGVVTTAALADGAVTAAKVATVSNWFPLAIVNPTPAASDHFGFAVAAVGTDRVLIGAFGDDDTGPSSSGAAYLFSTNGALLTTFTNPTPAAGDEFGISVAAMATDRVLIGAPFDDTGASNAGAVYLFSASGALLTTFTNPTPAIDDFFGWSVAALGADRVLIGARFDDTGASNAGAAYLFSTNGALLTTFTNPTPAIGDEFGFSVAALGADRVLIGARSDDTGATNAGAAYLFSTNGALLTTFTNPTPATFDEFGWSVAALGTDRVLIGAPFDDTGASRAGAAYLFTTNGMLLTTFTNPIPEGDAFGYSVAALGTDRVLIGADFFDTGATNASAAYLFSTNGVLLTTFTSPTPAVNDEFGSSVAAVGTDRVLIGSPGDHTGASRAGAAYLFSLQSYAPGLFAEGVRPGGITTAMLSNGAVTTVSLADGAVTAGKVATVSNWFALTVANPAPAAGDDFGWSVAAVGTDRLLIGAPFDDTGASGAGAAYLLSANGVLLTTFTNPAPAVNDGFGVSVATVGTDRVLIGAYFDDTGASNAGAAYLFSTNGALLTTFTNPTPAISDEFGFSVAAVGSDRVLIGARSDDTGATNAGAAYLFRTNGALLTTFTNPTPAVNDFFGFSVAAVGTDRVLIGAFLDNTGASGAGAAYLFSTNGVLLTTFTNPTPAFGDWFGYSVAAVGTDRVLIGQNAEAGADAAYLFSTNGALLTTFFLTPTTRERFGSSVAAVGTDRVLIGASDAGAAYLFNTNGVLLTTFTNPTPALFDNFGYSVAAVGSDRVLIGTPFDDTGASDAGAAYLFSIESYTPGLVADGVNARSITTASLEDGAVTLAKMDPTIGVWTRSGDNVYRLTGNVGIGTASPSNRLTVAGSGSFSSPDAAAITLDNTSANGRRWEWHALDDGRMQFADVDASATRLLIDTNGNVGIGTSSPSRELEVQHAGDTEIGLKSTDTGGHLWTIQSSGVTGDVNRDATFQIIDRTLGTARLLIGTNGNVGIGTNAPATALHVNSTVTATSISAAAGTAASVGYGFQGDPNTGMFSPAVNALAFSAAGNERMRIESGGNVGIGTNNPSAKLHVIGGITCTALTQTSDRNAKEHFQPVSAAEVLEKVAVLPITRWNFKELHDGQHLGPMAQDFHAAFGLGANDTTITALDEEGVALAAIQGLNQKLEEKEARIAALEKEVAELKRLLTKRSPEGIKP